MSYTVYVLFDIRNPSKDEYTGMTKQARARRHSNRLSSALSPTSNRNEPVNEWIREIGEYNVGHRTIATCATKQEAILAEEKNIREKTHLTKGGKNKRRK